MKIKKEIGIGFMTGLGATLSGIFLFTYFSSDLPTLEMLQKASEKGVVGNIIILGALINFLPFFVFLKKQQLYRVRGVLLSVFVAALVVAFFKVF